MTFISHLPKSHSISFLHRTTARLRPKTTIMRTSNVTRMSQNFNSKGQIEGHDVLGDELIEEEETLMRGAKVRKPLLIAAPVVVLIVALFVYLHGGRYETTDNAYLQSGLISVSSNVGGQVISVDVRENETVEKGDVLFRIDPRSYQTAVDEAEAQLAAARTQVHSLRANFHEHEAETKAAENRLHYAEGEAARQKELLAEGISSQAQYDQAVLAVQTAKQSIQTARQQSEGVRATLSGHVDAPAKQQPEVQRAQAALDRDRKSVVKGRSVYVSVYVGGARAIKKK